MPKMKKGMTETEQSEAFRVLVREKIAAGELNPTEADSAFDDLVGTVAKKATGSR